MKLASHFRYLPVLETQRQWGLFLVDCGYTVTEPNTPYPPRGHPATHDFTFSKGRILSDYHVVYITRGRGVFEAKGVRRKIVEAGDVMVLFPGVWHRYRPDPATGWEEQWAGFNGSQAERFMRPPFFNPKKPVLRIGLDEGLRQRFISMVNDIERNPAGTPFSSAARILDILGLIQENIQNVRTNAHLSSVIREAQNRILKEAMTPIDFERLARSLGVSYINFRRRFRQQTCVSPAQFQISIRLNRAQDLLSSTDLSVSEIAERCGFGTVHYFSRHFCQKMGLTPSAYRNVTRQ